MRKQIFAAVAGACAVLAVAQNARAVGGFSLTVTEFALSSGIFNSVFAKEMCSCQFVDGISLDQCEANDNLPSIASKIVDITVDSNAQSVHSAYKGHDLILSIVQAVGINDDFLLGGAATAQVDPNHPEFGCTLTHLPSDGQ